VALHASSPKFPATFNSYKVFKKLFTLSSFVYFGQQKLNNFTEINYVKKQISVNTVISINYLIYFSPITSQCSIFQTNNPMRFNRSSLNLQYHVPTWWPGLLNLF